MCYSFRIRPFCVVVTCGYRSISLLAIYCTLIDASLRRTINLWLFCVFSFILIKKLCPRHSFNLESVLNQTVSMTASFWNTFLKQFLMNKLWWWCMYSFFSTFFVWDLGDEMSCWVLATLLLFMSKLTCSSFYMEFNYTIKMPKDSLTLQNPLMALFVVTYTEKKRESEKWLFCFIHSKLVVGLWERLSDEPACLHKQKKENILCKHVITSTSWSYMLAQIQAKERNFVWERS